MEFVFPNEVHVTWTVMIVLYPFITGLVAGAFIISAIYHVFGSRALEPVARFSLVSAFVFLLFAPIPLVIHLGRPERAFNIMVTPNFESAMAGFGFIYVAFLVLVVLKIWFVMRGDFIRRALGQGAAAWVCRMVLMGNLHESDATKRADGKMVRLLSGIGIPLVCLEHGYVGFLFGSLKANPWWSTSLMFVIFVMSAIVSGIAVVIFHYFVVSWINRWEVNRDSVRSLARYLWGFMILAVSLELLELLSIAYKQTEEWEVLGQLIGGKLLVSYIIVQFLILSLLPFFMLAAGVLFRLPDRISHSLIWLASVMLLGQVLLMRWNVVVGGQLVSKSMRGFTSYFPGIWEKEGLIMAALIFIIPFLILYVFHRIVPLFPDARKKSLATPKS